MAPSHVRSDKGSRKAGGIRGAGDDALNLTIEYLKQETIEPLTGLGRFLVWGVAGSLAIAVGILLILLAILRVMQEETGTALTGNWSWVPYFVVSVLGLGVAGVAAWRITAGPGRRVAKVPRGSSATRRPEGDTNSREGSG
jgi:Putative Actinobacterial Holin-X, holin superfamily III